MKNILFIILLLITVITSAQNKSILLMNGVAHLGNDSIIQNSAIGIKDGKIILVGDARSITLDKTAFNEIINVEKYIIDIGLREAFSGGKSKNNKDYSKYTIKQLRKMVSKKGLTVTRKEGGYYRKSELISKIKNAQ